MRAQAAFLDEFKTLSGEEASGRYKDLTRALSIDLEGHSAYPAFQFDSDSVKHIVEQIHSELWPKVHDWSLALWYISANGWLDGARPVDLLDARSQAVLVAANRAAAEIL